ncbi:5'-nucleotidase C-terminal domain-containing protein [Bacillus infantis]|uniref:5'-nucleotidase C-terminal domain-containing protein n=1 Tax=Bacillus infantis TaxID=324767 RepID=UPI00301A14E1
MTKNRKFLATAATAAVVVSAVAPAASAANFQDVTDRYKDAVDFIISKGAKGLNGSSFGTSSEIKRVDAAVLLAKVLELNTQNAPASGFVDVPARAEGAVNALKAAGITSGKTKTTFDSNSSITRGELAIWLERGFGLKGDSSMEFKDVTPMYKNAVEALAANGVTKGITEDEFGVNLNAKRGDYAIFLHKSALVKENMVEVVSVESVNSTTLRVKVKGQLSDVQTSDFVFDGGLKVEAAKILPSVATEDVYTTVELITSVQEPGKTYKLTSFNGKSVIGDVVFKAPEGPSNPGTPGTPELPEGDYNLTVLHTNDTHAHLDNVAKKITAINDERANHENSLLLDAGDVFSGTLYFNEYNGLADLEFMNMAGYDAMTFGNHEFDKGTEILAPFVEAADFPFVSANVDFSSDENLKDLFNESVTSEPETGEIYNGIVKEINGEKVGIFGLTTAETVDISSPGEDVVFEDYVEEAEKAVEAFEAQGINKIIALTHIGFNDGGGDNDLTLAKEVDGIDIIVGGHSHDKLAAPVLNETGPEPTVIVQANEYSSFLGTLDVTFDAYGKVIGYAGELLDLSKYEENAEAKQILETKYKPKVQETQNKVIGSTDVALVGGNPAARTGETNLGNLITDGMLAKAKTINPETVIALQNGGGIRTSVPAGDVTLGKVLEVMPFGNALGIMKLKGSELKSALEHGVRQAPAANGGFLQISGMKFTYDSRKPAGERVLSVDVKGTDGNYTPLNNDQYYFVATNTFTAKGGDGFTSFEAAYKDGRVSEPGFVDWEIFKEYVEAQPNNKVSPTVEGRIIDKALVQGPEEVNAAEFSGTEASPKVYNGDVLVDVTDVTTLQYAKVTGDLYLKGNAEVNLIHVTVDGETHLVD